MFYFNTNITFKFLYNLRTLLYRSSYSVKMFFFLFEVLVKVMQMIYDDIMMFVFVFFSRNKLKEFPLCICQCRNLVSLHVEYNEIKVISQEIGSLRKLEELVCIILNSHLHLSRYIWKVSIQQWKLLYKKTALES